MGAAAPASGRREPSILTLGMTNPVPGFVTFLEATSLSDLASDVVRQLSNKSPDATSADQTARVLDRLNQMSDEAVKELLAKKR